MSSAVAYAAHADSFEAGGVAKQISPAAEGGKLDFDRYWTLQRILNLKLQQLGSFIMAHLNGKSQLISW